MRILHVVPSYAARPSHGGDPVHAVGSLAAAQAAAGHHVEVFATDAGAPADAPLGAPVEVDGVGVSTFAVSAPRRLFYAGGMATALAERARGFDVLHLHSLFLWPTLAAARAARRAGVPYVVSPRGALAQDALRRGGGLRKSAWLTLFERTNLEEAALVHATSEREVADVCRFPWRWPRFAVVPNGVELPTGEPDGRALSLPIRDLAQRPFVLYLGHVGADEGLEPLLDAVARLDGVHLVLAGPDDDGVTLELLVRARERGSSTRVVAVGEVHGADKRFLLENAAALALPARSESSGAVVLEALAHGTPVVCTPRVRAAELVRETGAGRVVEALPGPLADSLRDLARGAVPPDALARARARVRDEHSWARAAARLGMELDRAVADAPPSAA